MEELSVGDGGFDAVADGVSEVEEGADIEAFFFIGFDDSGFDGDVAGDEVGENGAECVEAKRAEGVGVGVEKGEHVGVADSGVLDDFGETFDEGAGGEGFKGEGVNEDEAGVVEGADEVFPGGEVDACFATDGAVYLGENGGGDLNEGDATVVDGGDESGEVADDASAEGDEEGVPVYALLGKGGADGFDGGEGF